MFLIPYSGIPVPGIPYHWSVLKVCIYAIVNHLALHGACAESDNHGKCVQPSYFAHFDARNVFGGSGWDVVGRLKYLKSCLRLSPSLFLLLGHFFCLSTLTKSLLQASVVEKYIFKVMLEMVLTNLVLCLFFRC